MIPRVTIILAVMTPADSYSEKRDNGPSPGPLASSPLLHILYRKFLLVLFSLICLSLPEWSDFFSL